MNTQSKPKKTRQRKQTKRMPKGTGDLPMLLETKALHKLSADISAHYYPVSLPTQLFLLNVNPHCLHATWNIRKEDAHKVAPLSAALPDNDELTLRLHRINPGAPAKKNDRKPVIEILVHGLENVYYIHPLKGAGLYQAEIGLHHQGEFVSIICSNTIHVPPPKIRKTVPFPLTWADTRQNVPLPAGESPKQTQKKISQSPDTSTPAGQSDTLVHTEHLSVNGHQIPPYSEVRRWSGSSFFDISP